MAAGEGSKAAYFDEILLQPLNYIKQRPGKQIRSRITNVFNFWLNIPMQKCVEIGEIIQTGHNISILVDDVQDNSKLRRGIPAAHHIFGVPSTINSANYALYLSFEKTLKLGHPEAARVYADHILELIRGQEMDIYWRDSFLCPTEDEYKEMAKKKTAAFYSLIMKLMQLFSDNKSDFSGISTALGLYFQIRDDYINLNSEEYIKSKGFCEDFTEGKFSFPIIHSIRSNLDDPRLMNIIKQRTTDVEIKKCALDIMEKTGSFEYCRKALMDLDALARKEIEQLGHNAHLLSLLDALKMV